MRDITGLRIDQIAKELRHLTDNLRKLNDANADDLVTEPIHDRVKQLALGMVKIVPKSGDEMAIKAGVVLDWLTSDADVSSMLSASLCRDVVLMFPADT